MVQNVAKETEYASLGIIVIQVVAYALQQIVFLSKQVINSQPPEHLQKLSW